jgi:hypothetical protein
MSPTCRTQTMIYITSRRTQHRAATPKVVFVTTTRSLVFFSWCLLHVETKSGDVAGLICTHDRLPVFFSWQLSHSETELGKHERIICVLDQNEIIVRLDELDTIIYLIQ